MGTRTIAVLLLLTLRVVAQAQIEIPKEWRGQTQAELLALPEIGRMPFVAQDQILDALEPGHISIPWAQRRQPLLLAEQGRATAENRKPRSVLVWAKANEDICIDYFTDGEHYYAISLPSLFVSVKIMEFEKYVRAWIYVSNDKNSRGIYEVFGRNISYASIAPKPELREPVGAEQIARSLSKGSRWKAALVAGLGGFATTTTIAQQSGTFNGSNSSGAMNGSFTGSSTTTAPDYATRGRAVDNAARIRANAERKGEAILETALRDNTVFAGSAVNGFVYFKRDHAHDASGVLRVIIGTLSIEFPVKW